MSDTFEKLALESGVGNTKIDGHKSRQFMVLQKAPVGQFRSPENEQDNPISVAQARSAVGNQAGIDEDDVRCERYQDLPNVLVWTFSFSNDGLFDLGPGADDPALVTTGTFNQQPISVQRVFPALAVTKAKIGGGWPLPVVQEFNIYEQIDLAPITETKNRWKVKCITNLWNENVATDIAIRRGTMHIINGNLFEFQGVAGVNKLGDSGEYEVTYQWDIDGGTVESRVASDQDDDQKIILPPKVASGDAALTTPIGYSFAGDYYTRLPYHEVVIGKPEVAGDQPPFVQLVLTDFDPSKINDWQLLPGDPIGTV